MALSGTIRTNTGAQLDLRIDWAATQSAPGNYSDVTAKVYLEYRAIYVSARSDASVTINGNTLNFSTPAINASSTAKQERLLATHKVRVTHNDSGGKSCAISAGWRFGGTYNGVSIGWLSPSGTATLNTIDRNPATVTVTVGTVTANSASITVTASTTCDTWEYNLNGGAWKRFAESSGTSKTYTITGLSPNTSYSIRAAAKKTYNQVWGYSAAKTAKTLGTATINGAQAVTIDADNPRLSINWTICAAGFTYRLAVRDGTTKLLEFTSITAAVGISAKQIELTADQKNTVLTHMRAKKSFTATYAVTTWSGMTQIGGESTKTATVTTAAANSAPEFTNPTGYTYRDTNQTTTAITGNNQIMIQGYSAMAITAYAATPKNAAAIARYEATADTAVVSSPGTSLAIGAIHTAGNIPVRVSAYDTRGYSVTAQKSVEVVEYAPVIVKDYAARRINEVEDMIQLSFSGEMSEIVVAGESKNAIIRAEYRAKITSEEAFGDWVEFAPPTSAARYTYQARDFAEYSWNLEIRITDKLTSYTFAVIIPQGIPSISIRRKKVGINNRNPQAALNIVGGGIIDGAQIWHGKNLRIAAGRIDITPTAANAPTSAEIRFADGLFSATPVVTVTPITTVPGTEIKGVSASGASREGFRIYLTRSNTVTTGVYWQAIQI